MKVLVTIEPKAFMILLVFKMSLASKSFLSSLVRFGEFRYGNLSTIKQSKNYYVKGYYVKRISDYYHIHQFLCLSISSGQQLHRDLYNLLNIMCQ